MHSRSVRSKYFPCLLISRPPKLCAFWFAVIFVTSFMQAVRAYVWYVRGNPSDLSVAGSAASGFDRSPPSSVRRFVLGRTYRMRNHSSGLAHSRRELRAMGVCLNCERLSGGLPANAWRFVWARGGRGCPLQMDGKEVHVFQTNEAGFGRCFWHSSRDSLLL